MWVMQLISHLNTILPEDTYLARYDPDGDGGFGTVVATRGTDSAMKFETVGECMELWKVQSNVVPFRPDGKPNRPLSAFTMMPINLDRK